MMKHDLTQPHTSTPNFIPVNVYMPTPEVTIESISQPYQKQGPQGLRQCRTVCVKTCVGGVCVKECVEYCD